MNNCIEPLGDALGANEKLQNLFMRNTRIRVNNYSNFWSNLCENKNLRKISVQKTDLNDKVAEKLAEYLKTEDLKLVELDLSRN